MTNHVFAHNVSYDKHFILFIQVGLLIYTINIVYLSLHSQQLGGFLRTVAGAVCIGRTHSAGQAFTLDGVAQLLLNQWAEMSEVVECERPGWRQTRHQSRGTDLRRTQTQTRMLKHHSET